jgi:hypothetical protein
MAGWAEKLGTVLSGGFGPEVVQGLIAGYFEKISTEKYRQYIQEKSNLTERITEKQWETLRKAARACKINLSYEEIVRQIKANRPDVLGIIITTDGGVVWLRRQVEEVKKKLA